MRQTERMGAHGSTETRKPVHSAIEGFPIFHVGINLKESKLLRGFRGQRFTRKSGNTPLRYRGSEWGQFSLAEDRHLSLAHLEILNPCRGKPYML